MSGLVESPWPIFTNVGPKSVKIPLSSAALCRFLCSSCPLRSSKSSFAAKVTSAVNTSIVLCATWILTRIVRARKWRGYHSKLQDSISEPWSLHPIPAIGITPKTENLYVCNLISRSLWIKTRGFTKFIEMKTRIRNSLSLSKTF